MEEAASGAREGRGPGWFPQVPVSASPATPDLVSEALGKIKSPLFTEERGIATA